MVNDGDLVPQQPEKLSYMVVSEMMENSLIGKETITFKREDWEKTQLFITQTQNFLRDIASRTPVEHAYGICTKIGCQWNQIEAEREKWKKTQNLLKPMNEIINDLVKLCLVLTEEKVPIEGDWFKSKFAEINRRVEDMRLK